MRVYKGLNKKRRGKKMGERKHQGGKNPEGVVAPVREREVGRLKKCNRSGGKKTGREKGIEYSLRWKPVIYRYRPSSYYGLLSNSSGRNNSATLTGPRYSLGCAADF